MNNNIKTLAILIGAFSFGVFTAYHATKDSNKLAVNFAHAANALVIDCEKRTGKDCFLDARIEP